jgi:uncharacterized SAM-binding protein YcdF (DUF218 family)
MRKFPLFVTFARYGRNLAIVFACFWLMGLWLFAQHIPVGAAMPMGHYDAIIALTGGGGRISYAVDLLRQNKADTLFISGVADGFSVDDLALIERAPKDSAIAQLRPRIFYGHRAHDTIGNAKETLEWLKSKPYRSLLIVTANYHIPRTRILFTYYLPDHTLTYVPINPPQFERVAWLSHPNSLRLVVSEYHKIILTWLRYDVLRGWI